MRFWWRYGFVSAIVGAFFKSESYFDISFDATVIMQEWFDFDFQID
jgi:hypothetical protein